MSQVQTPSEQHSPIDSLQLTFQNTFRHELAQMIADLGIPPEGRVLDVPCGAGFYSCLLAGHLQSQGLLVAADCSETCLTRARAALHASEPRCGTQVEMADIYALPFTAGSFDLAWCAQSLISIEDQVTALKELARVVRPGGLIAVLENDEYHHVLLPWPVELEERLQQALRKASEAQSGKASHYSPSRRTRRFLLEAGLAVQARKTISADRHGPFSPSVKTFLEQHLDFLGSVVTPYLSVRERQHFAVLADPDNPQSFFMGPRAEFTCLNTLYLARRT